MDYTKFEIARLIGARALQIKMGAPILIKIPKGINKPVNIAKLELEMGVLPITVKRVERKNVEKKKVSVIPEIPEIEEEETEKEILEETEGMGESDT